jgi:hypothetical protein
LQLLAPENCSCTIPCEVWIWLPHCREEKLQKMGKNPEKMPATGSFVVIANAPRTIPISAPISTLSDGKKQSKGPAPATPRLPPQLPLE